MTILKYSADENSKIITIIHPSTKNNTSIHAQITQKAFIYIVDWITKTNTTEYQLTDLSLMLFYLLNNILI